MLDHNNLEEFADPINYDRADPGDTGFAFETRNPLLPNVKTREGFFVTLETLGEEVRRIEFTDTRQTKLRRVLDVWQ